jgi:hypothetical protein
MAVMLALAAGLLVRTVANLTRVDAGFNRSRMITFSMTLPRTGTEADGRALAFQRLLDTLRQMPGVQAATAMSDLPFKRLAQRYNTGAENTDASPVAIVDYYQFVMSDYFLTMGSRSWLVAGSTPPTRHREAGASSSMKPWPTGCGRGAIRSGNACARTWARRSGRASIRGTP